MKDLIAAIEAEAFYLDNPERNFIYVDDCIELINKALEGKVIVPVELIQNIDDLTESGMGAEDQIDELCLLLPTSDNHEAN